MSEPPAHALGSGGGTAGRGSPLERHRWRVERNEGVEAKGN